MTLLARSVTVRRRDRTILAEATLGVPAGRVTALIGPNGAGKSTLLRVLAGDIVPDAGRVTLDGAPLSARDADALARRRAVLHQQLAVAAAFSVAEVVQLGRYPHRLTATRAHDAAAVAAALSAADVLALAGRAAPTLSGGEAHRMHFARVLAQLDDQDREPRHLLLDEPTASLDLNHQHGLMTLLRARAAAGWGVGVVLHDLNLALAYADDVCVLQGGRVVLSGPVAEVMRPETLGDVFAVKFALSHCPLSGRQALASWT